MTNFPRYAVGPSLELVIKNGSEVLDRENDSKNKIRKKKRGYEFEWNR